MPRQSGVPVFAAPDGYGRDVVGDAELAIAAAGGDRDALAAIYDRYADTLYELCRVILRDGHEAADALQDTFVIATTRLSGLRDPERLKSWLCAIARREAIRRSSKRARMRPSHDELLDVPVVDDAAGGLIANDAAALVWEAAESLTERERALLVLNVRQGLDGADLADAAGLDGPQASVVLSRAKSQLAVAVRCTLLIRHGRADCSALNAIVPHAHHALDGLTRKRVARHALACTTCEPKWNASPNALGVLAAAPLLGAPAALKGKVLNDPRLISTSKPLGGGGWARDGFPRDVERSRRPILASLVAALLLIGVAVVLVVAGDNDTRPLAAPDKRSDTTALGATPSTTGDAAITAGVPPTRRGVTTTTTKRGPSTTAKPGAAVTTTITIAPTTTTIPPFRVTASSSRSRMRTCETASVTATTENGSAPNGLWLHYSNASGGGSKNMNQSGATTWTGTLGPIADVGPAQWWVSTDPFGSGGTRSATHSIDIYEPCPQ